MFRAGLINLGFSDSQTVAVENQQEEMRDTGRHPIRKGKLPDEMCEAEKEKSLRIPTSLVDQHKGVLTGSL